MIDKKTFISEVFESMAVTRITIKSHPVCHDKPGTGYSAYFAV